MRRHFDVSRFLQRVLGNVTIKLRRVFGNEFSAGQGAAKIGWDDGQLSADALRLILFTFGYEPWDLRALARVIAWTIWDFGSALNTDVSSIRPNVGSPNEP